MTRCGRIRSSRRPAARVVRLGAFLSAVGLAACAADGAAPDPVVLSYPYAADATVAFAGHRRLARTVAGAYVRVLVLGESVDDGILTAGIVNGASGVIVDNRGYVVTVAHIAKSTLHRAEVTTMDGVRRAADIIDVSPGRELALLRIAPFPGMQAAATRAAAPARYGQPVVSIGTPDNRMGVVSLGAVTVPRRAGRVSYGEYGYDGAVELAMEVEPGHSGGPVFDDRGRLVGIVASFGLGNTRRVPYVSTRVAYAVPAAAISVYLAELLGR